MFCPAFAGVRIPVVVRRVGVSIVVAGTSGKVCVASPQVGAACWTRASHQNLLVGPSVRMRMFLVVVIVASTISLCGCESSFMLWCIVFTPIILGFMAFMPLRAVRAGRMHSAPVVPVSRGWLTLLVPLGAIVVTIIIVIILSIDVVVTWSSIT